jgi:hypothetical protein
LTPDRLCPLRSPHKAAPARGFCAMGKVLTAKRLREVLDYFPGTGEFRWKVRASNRTKIGAIAGSGHRDGYVSIRIDGVDHFAARLAVLWMTGSIPQVASGTSTESARTIAGAT